MTLSYCGDLVRQHDPDRFLLSLFAKPAGREALWALYAFNYEIAKTREVVTETQLGLIRLQWWREAIAGVYAGKVPAHQVIEPLAAAIKSYSLPQELFDNLIYGREFDLEDKLPATLDGMANYADFTSTPLVKLALKVEGAACDDKIAQAAGTAYALAGLLRAVPNHLRHRRCFLPEDLLRKAGIDHYALYEGKGIDKLAPVVGAIVQRARASSSLILKSAPLHAALLKKMADMYLAQIEGAKFNLFSSALQHPPPMFALRLWWAKVTH